MRFNVKYLFTTLALCGVVSFSMAQVEGEEDEEDYSMYDNLDFADGEAKRFCSSKIKGLSPAKLISIGYDVQGAQTLTAGSFAGPADAFGQSLVLSPAETRNIDFSHGLRVAANIPVISRNNIIVQLGANHWSHAYEYSEPAATVLPVDLHRALQQDGLQTTGINTTVFKPFNEKSFVIFQGSMDVNGNYSWANFQSPAHATYSAALIWGQRPSDNKQWGVGLSRTYRAGELNYIPVFLFNWTSTGGKWGTELLLPARGHVRYTFNPRSMLFAGFELEGQSYRLNNNANVDWYGTDFVELRRSELRFRLVYERSIYNFIWISAQAGYRVNYLFDLDQLDGGNEFFRGFFGDQPYFALNELSNTPYFNISINLVSP